MPGNKSGFPPFIPPPNMPPPGSKSGFPPIMPGPELPGKEPGGSPIILIPGLFVPKKGFCPPLLGPTYNGLVYG